MFYSKGKKKLLCISLMDVRVWCISIALLLICLISILRANAALFMGKKHSFFRHEVTTSDDSTEYSGQYLTKDHINILKD